VSQLKGQVFSAIGAEALEKKMQKKKQRLTQGTIFRKAYFLLIYSNFLKFNLTRSRSYYK